MREPVTTISSTAGAWAVWAGAVCAAAGWIDPSVPASSASAEVEAKARALARRIPDVKWIMIPLL
jgi:hypothetical protein